MKADSTTDEQVYQWRIKISFPGSEISFMNAVFEPDDIQRDLAVSFFKGIPLITGKKTLVFYKSLSETQVEQIRDELYSRGVVNLTIEKLKQ